MSIAMNMNPIEAYIIMEAIGEPCKPEILKVVESTNNFYVKFRTCLQSFDRFNRNGRNYNLAPMIQGFQADHIQELIKKGTWCGQNGHPDSDDTKIVLTIDPKLISHRMLNYEFVGSKVYSEVETLNDDLYGKQFTKHILQGIEPAFSLRALASITKIDGRRGIVKTRPHIVTYDRVILPSHDDAYRDTSKPVSLITPDMKDVVRESTLYQDHSFKVMENSAIDFILQESCRVKSIIDIFEVAYESVSLSADMKSVIIRDPRNNRKFNVNLESYVDNQVGKCLSNLI